MAHPAADWNPRFVPESGGGQAIFEPLRQRFGSQMPATWPTLDQLGNLLGPRTCNALGRPLRLRWQAARLSGLEYERYVYQQATLPVRRKNWHDVFNLLMWRLWPLSKAALNAVHFQTGSDRASERGRTRDLATLLDETGVVLAVRDEQALGPHRRHDWQRLFVTQRSHWGRSIVPLVLGHGLLEQCRQPYVGLTAKSVALPMPEAWFQMDDRKQQCQADAALAALLPALHSPRQLLPLPVLGVPGWCDANQDPAYYDNRAYFRPLRQPLSDTPGT